VPTSRWIGSTSNAGKPGWEFRDAIGHHFYDSRSSHGHGDAEVPGVFGQRPGPPRGDPHRPGEATHRATERQLGFMQRVIARRGHHSVIRSFLFAAFEIDGLLLWRVLGLSEKPCRNS